MTGRGPRSFDHWLVPALAAMEFIILFSPLTAMHAFRRKRAPAAPAAKYSAAALARALHTDIDALADFAATTDLTAENIDFLRRVAAWKARWRGGGADAAALLGDAAAIWAELVDRDSARFPLNIDDGVYRALAAVFAPAAARADDARQIAPFADCFEGAGLKGCLDRVLVVVRAGGGGGVDEALFDGAEACVLQMVLENTWIRYVDSRGDDRKGGAKERARPLRAKKRRGGFWRKGCL